jgi:SAM-dependent methyltransferase
LDAGGTITVTEMSKPSFELLQARFRGTPQVRVLYDEDGAAPLRDGSKYDVILLLSVIHHIPDYVGAITTLCDEVLNTSGVVVTFQDPLWYPRQSRTARWANWGSYFAWRITQGELRRGVKTRIRRARGKFDDTEPSDLVEYHVVRNGVDDVALVELLQSRFREVDVDRYFSTQLPVLQRIGTKIFPVNNFGIVARGFAEARA